MKFTLVPLFFIFYYLLLTGCFAPVNSVYENAKLLEEGEAEIMGSYSTYYGQSIDLETLEPKNDHINQNFGIAAGYGFTNKFNLRVRYEYLELKIDLGDNKRVNYFEVNSKINIIKDRLAFSIPFGFYYLNHDRYTFSLDPRLIASYRVNNNFEMTAIPKVHCFYGNKLKFIPGFTFGIGLSSDLNKWAIRPEVGYDGYVYFGMSANVLFTLNKK